MRPFFYLICLIVLFTIGVTACKKDNANSNVPMVVVDFYIYTNQPQFVPLNPIGGWVQVTGGVRGIIIYRKSSSEFMAYDRNCTYQPSNPKATVYVDATNIIVTDSSCHSKFSIYDGNVTQGPAVLPLKRYNSTFDGNVLHVYN